MRRGLSLFVQEDNGVESSRPFKSSEGIEDSSPIQQKQTAKKNLWFLKNRSVSEAEKKFQGQYEASIILPEMVLLVFCLLLCLFALIVDLIGQKSFWRIGLDGGIILFQTISMVLLYKWRRLLIFVNYMNLILMSFFFCENFRLSSEEMSGTKPAFYMGYIFSGITVLHLYIDRKILRKGFFFLIHLLIILGRISLFSPWWATFATISLFLINMWFNFNMDSIYNQTINKLKLKREQVKAWKHINERVLPNGYVVFQPINYLKLEKFFKRFSRTGFQANDDEANNSEIEVNPSVSEWASHIKVLMINKIGRDLLGTDDPEELLRLLSETPISDLNSEFKIPDEYDMELSYVPIVKSEEDKEEKVVGEGRNGARGNWQSEKNLLRKVAECFLKMKINSDKNMKFLRNQSIVMDHIINQPIQFRNKEKPMYFDISFSVFLWKRKLSLLMVISDISEKVLNQRDKEIQEFQDELISSVSHELRTPLNSIIGTLSYLETRCKDPQLMNDISQIQISCDMLLSRINDILDYSQSLKKKRLEMEATGFTIEELIKPLVRIFQKQVEEKKMKLTVIMDPALRIVNFSTDHCRLKQVLINLLTNAVKFTFKGEIGLTIKKIEEGQILFEIKDTGIGMSKAGMAKLFRVQKKVGTDINANGIGFGLTISNYIVGHLGPKEEIRVESNLNQGSKFSFIIFETLKPVRGKKREMTIQIFNTGNLRESLDSSMAQSWFSKNDFLERPRNNKHYTLFPYQLGNFKHLVPSQVSLSADEVSDIMTNENEQNNPKSIEAKVLMDRSLARRCRSVDYLLNNTKDVDPINELIKMTDLKFELKLLKGNSNETNSTPSFNEYLGIENNTKPSSDTVVESKGLKLSTGGRQLNVQVLEEIKEREAGSGEIAVAETIETRRTIHVMIVDDTPFNLILLEKFLSEILDFRILVSKAYNGKEAIDIAGEATPPVDIYYMDCNMPILDGYEATKILKKKMKEGKMKSAPVLAITAWTGKDNEKKCYEHHMDDFIPKPVTKQRFTEIFRKWVK